MEQLEDKNFQAKRLAGKNVVLDCGWGRLIFGQTFDSNKKIAKILCDEGPGKRDIAFYLRDPHVVISLAPQEIFLDPSHTYRLWLDYYRPAQRKFVGFTTRFLTHRSDADEIQELYLKHKMIPPGADFVWENRQRREITYIVAVEEQSNKVLGAVFGVDHHELFADLENGSSLWALVVDPQAVYPGIGEALVRQLAEYYMARGRSFMDLSVLHDNEQAIALYEKLGFHRVVIFALKHKNPYNEPLFIAPAPEDALNPYAKIIVNEARRRGIGIEVLDAEYGYFALSFGGRSVVCRESLTEFTSAIAMSRCDNKIVTHRILEQASIRVPAQIISAKSELNLQFLQQYKRIVVKPARGEQGLGISVDVRSVQELENAVQMAKQFSDCVLLEEFVTGLDVRILVINFEVVAAAQRCPPQIIGNGIDTVLDLIHKQSRRRSAATGGESNIPIDQETTRCVNEAGYAMTDILPTGQNITVRKTANLHTGGTIYDVTPQLSDTLRQVAVRAAQVINIPVVGFDFLLPDIQGKDYVIIEANERPGLANHEPQPTAARFIDMLFPQTISGACYEKNFTLPDRR
jgi:GNAT-family acetyltransferase (TIGR03103 family)